MGIRKYKPTSPGTRFRSGSDFSEITTTKPYKPLLRPIKKTGGRSSSGRISSWQKGGGHKRAYRIIDFKRNKLNIPCTVETIEYDPNRTSRIALLKYADGERRYMLAPVGVKVGDSLVSGEGSEIKTGNAHRTSSFDYRNRIALSRIGMRHKSDFKLIRVGRFLAAPTAGVDGDMETIIKIIACPGRN